ncbi:hypothetical protein SRHO_G00326970 [Serrasalmus rhombeus]
MCGYAVTKQRSRARGHLQRALHPSANQISMQTSAVPPDPVTFPTKPTAAISTAPLRGVSLLVTALTSVLIKTCEMNITGQKLGIKRGSWKCGRNAHTEPRSCRRIPSPPPERRVTLTAADRLQEGSSSVRLIMQVKAERP